MPDPETRIATFTAKNGDHVVIDEYNGCIVAYYYHGDEITGHAWLFNVGLPEEDMKAGHEVSMVWADSSAPISHHQSGREGNLGATGPTPLKPDLCHPHQIDPPLSAEDFRAFFNDENQTTGIYFRNRLTGIIWNGAKPGKSAYAKAPSKFALPMAQDG